MTKHQAPKKKYSLSLLTKKKHTWDTCSHDHLSQIQNSYVQPFVVNEPNKKITLINKFFPKQAANTIYALDSKTKV